MADTDLLRSTMAYNIAIWLSDKQWELGEVFFFQMLNNEWDRFPPDLEEIRSWEPLDNHHAYQISNFYSLMIVSLYA